MSFAILKCKCGKVFPYYECAQIPVKCTNTHICSNKFLITEETTIKSKIGIDFVAEPNTAYIYIQVYNNNAYLAARVYSEDAGNFMVIPINERNVGGMLSRKDTLLAIPADKKHLTAWDGLVIASGCYPVSKDMEMEIRRNLCEVTYAEPETDKTR